MCGITGLVTQRPAGSSLDGLQRSLRALQHRGPDDSGWLQFPDPPVPGPVAYLGNRRLQIIDLSPAGHQPMTTVDGRFSLTYNGEVYNYRELRAELEAAGARFVSGCDTEVVLQAFAVLGAGCFARFEGMFALAIIDRSTQRLWLARDPFGIKPLYYRWRDTTFAFASEIGALLALGDASRQVNLERLYDYLTTSNVEQGAETLLTDIRQVPPAHYLSLPLDLGERSSPIRYSRLEGHQGPGQTFLGAAEELKSLFRDSVRLHLRSDVPVGFSLSGGVDSSSVLLAAREVLGPSGPLRAYSFVTPEPEINEAVHQERAAKAAGAVLHQVTVEARDLARDFDNVVDLQGGPFGSPTIYAQYRIFAHARETGVKVILGGQGGDEMFAGYDWYVPSRVASLVKQLHWSTARRLVRTATGDSRAARRNLMRKAFALAAPPLVRRWARSAGGKAPSPGWVNHRWFQNRGVARPIPWHPKGRHVLNECLADSMENLHLQGLMRYEDRSAMALSMENRVPFLTYRLARFVLSLPEEYLISDSGEHKAVFRQAMRGLVPDAILDRRDKIGFAVPAARWLLELEPWVERRLALAAQCPAVHHAALQGHWNAVRARQDVRSAFALWRCFSLVSWAERMGVSWS